jgi:hypothetical protein
MYSALCDDSMNARVAELDRKAQHDSLAFAARRARRRQSGPRLPALAAVLTRRALTVLGAHSSP